MKRICIVVSMALALFAQEYRACADELDELSLDGWKQLREVERYQLQIAEKYWRELNWKTAAAEYEKFMELYESSSGALTLASARFTTLAPQAAP